MEQIVARFAEQPVPLFACRSANRLHDLDLERFRWKFHAGLMNRANSSLNDLAPSYGNTYRVISKSGAGSRSRSRSGFQVISNWLIIVICVGLPTMPRGTVP